MIKWQRSDMVPCYHGNKLKCAPLLSYCWGHMMKLVDLAFALTAGPYGVFRRSCERGLNTDLILG